MAHMEVLWVGMEIMFKGASSMGGTPASMAPLGTCDLCKHGKKLEVTMGLSYLKTLLIEINSVAIIDEYVHGICF